MVFFNGKRNSEHNLELVWPGRTWQGYFSLGVLEETGSDRLVGASSRRLKGCWFNSWPGHMPRLQVWSLVEIHTKGNQSMFLLHIDISLSLLSPPLPLSLKSISMASGED